MKLAQLMVRPFMAITLMTVGGAAHAIGDSGGSSCSIGLQYAQVLGLGSVADVESHISSTLSRSAEFLDRKQKAAFSANPTLLKAWQHDTRLKMLHEQCGSFPLDYAVGHGNLEVVRWLLDSGVDPSATSMGSRSNVFTRCNSGGLRAPVGMSPEQVAERRRDAYRMLVARGAEINALDPFAAIYGCLNREMLPLLHQLGAQVTSGAFVSRVRSVRTNGPINESNWAVVEQLAKWQAFDFRGTAFEAELLMMLEARSNMSDYDAVVELTRRLSKVVRLNPGIVPGTPARTDEVPSSFAPERAGCNFPEVGAYPNFEVHAVWRDDAHGTVSAPDTTAVKVGRTKAPVLLALVNNRDTPTTWRISRSSGAHILGVMVLSNFNGRGSKDSLMFDPLRPAFLGPSYRCAVTILSESQGRPRNELRPDGPAKPGYHSFIPFRLRGEPPIAVSQGNQFVVGEVSPAEAMISWTHTRR